MNKDNTHFNLFEPQILPLSQVINPADAHYELPRFQRNFVWKPKDMRELMESIYEGIPVNSIYLWKRAGVILKDRSESDEKTLLVIDGQQRLTTLRAILLGEEYQNGTQKRKFQLAFNPIAGTFYQVTRKTLTPSERHIGNIAQFYADPGAERLAYFNRNAEKLNPEEKEIAGANLARLAEIRDYRFPVYYLSDEVEIETAHKCFERANEAGTTMSQGDLCMAWLETYQPLLAEGIIVFGKGIKGEAYEQSKEFSHSKFANALKWLNISEPTDEPFRPKVSDITDLLFHITQGGVGFKLGSVAEQLLKDEGTLNGNDSATTGTGSLVEKAFFRLVNQKNYTRFNKIIKSFPRMDAAEMKFAYWLFLECVETEKRDQSIARLLKRWFFLQTMSVVRKSGAVAFSMWMRGFKNEGGLRSYLKSIEDELKPDLWHETLPSKLSDSLPKQIRTKVMRGWTMVHVLSKDTPLFDSSTLVETLGKEKSEHHIFAQNRLDGKVSPSKIDAIANMAITSTEINSAMSDKPMHVYIANEEAHDRLPDKDEQLAAHCIPKQVSDGNRDADVSLVDAYEDFLTERAKLMAVRFRDAYLALKE